MGAGHPDNVFWQAAWACVILTDPFTRGLGGASNFEQKHLSKLLLIENAPFLSALTYRLPNSIALPMADVVDLIRYWDAVDSIESRSDMLGVIEETTTRVRFCEFETASQILEDNRDLLEGVFKESTRQAQSISLRPKIDFSFSVLAPTVLALVEPLLGTGVALASSAAKHLKNQHWNAMNEKLSYLLAGASDSIGGREKIAIGTVLHYRD